jgi:hypothetical protein
MYGVAFGGFVFMTMTGALVFSGHSEAMKHMPSTGALMLFGLMGAGFCLERMLKR